MTAKQLKMIEVNQSDYSIYLKRSKEFYEGMKIAVSNNLWNLAGLDGVHSAISMTDALTTYHMRKVFSGDDHRQAYDLVSRMPVKDIGSYAKSYERIISKKYAVAYENRQFFQKEALDLVKLVERYYEWAIKQLP